MDDLLLLLRLQSEWGADEALDPDPVERLRALTGPAQPAERPPPSAAGRASPIAPLQPVVAPVARAAAVASAAQTLEALRDAIAAFDGCALRDTASHLVWAEGDGHSATLIIGEAPGRDEDRSGHPFAGAEGELLDKMLASIRLTRSALMLAPLLPWRPPGGRPPSATELAVCLPFLHRLIVLQQPRFVLLLGNTPSRALLPAAAARRRQAPSWIELGLSGMPNPAAALVLPSMGEMIKTPPTRRIVWAGLRLLRRALDAI